MALPFVELGVLVVALAAIALALLITAILKSVASHIPSAGGLLDPLRGAVLGMASGISYVLGKAEAGIDAAIGASWHALARLTDRLWSQIESAASGYLQLAELVASLVYAHSGLRALVHRAEAIARGIEHGVKTLEREFHGIEGRVARLDRELTQGIGHDLRIGLRDLTNEVHGVEHTVTTTLPKAIGYAEGQIASLRDFIKAIPGVNYLDWVGGIVAAGLAAIGMDWLICRSRSSVNGKTGCNLWDDIEGLLGLATAAFAFANLEELLKVAEEVEVEVVTVARDVLSI